MSLTAEERELAAGLGMPEEACVLVKEAAGGKALRPFVVYREADGDGTTVGVSVDVRDGEEAERVMVGVQAALLGRGCRAFWSQRRESNGWRDSDVMAVVKGTDHLAFVRAVGTNGWNYDVSPEDVLKRLRAWGAVCDFEVVGASEDWVAVQFKTLPADVCAFAAEVYLFCPDTVGQGVGLVRPADDPELYAGAKALCPEVAPEVRRRATEQFGRLGGMSEQIPESLRAMMPRSEVLVEEAEMGVRLLAYELRRKKYLFLWWD